MIVIYTGIEEIDKEIQMNNATIEDLNDRYYAALGAVNMDGLPHGKGGVSKPVENMVANVPEYVRKKIAGKQQHGKADSKQNNGDDDNIIFCDMGPQIFK